MPAHRPPARPRRPGSRWRVAVAVFALVLAAVTGTACTADESRGPTSTTTSVPPPPTTGATTTVPLGPSTPAFEPLSDAFTYGDDPALDELWDACAAGAGIACDDLYFAAPTDSEYENFGYTCGDRPNVIICTELDDDDALFPPST